MKNNLTSVLSKSPFGGFRGLLSSKSPFVGFRGLLTLALLFPLWGLGGSAFAQSRVVEVRNISANYTAQPPTVTFEVFWTGVPDNIRHRDTVWVFVDYQIVNDNGTLGTWTAATLSSPVPAGQGTVVPNSLNGRGFYLAGNPSSSFSSTVTVALEGLDAGAKFSWCAYATDYPPNATIGAGHYNLHGTPPFIVNGDSLAATERTYSNCIDSLTDATGCPGLYPERPVIEAFIPSATTICSGESITLEAIATGATSYSFNGGTSWTPAASVTLFPETSTNYTLYVANAAGCTVSYSPAITVTVDPTPVISSFSATPNTICSGESALLIVSATGATSYSINSGGSWTSDTTFRITPASVTASTNIDYTVYVQSDKGCTATAIEIVTVNPLPVPSITMAASTACAGGTIKFTASGGSSYCFTEICTACVRNPYLTGNDAYSIADCAILTVPCTYTEDSTYSLIAPERGSVEVWVRAMNEYGCIDSISTTVDAYGSAFVDDVWYFGENATDMNGKSPGIRFVRDTVSGEYEARDASRESNVYSAENSLVVSSPYCDGQNIFYMSHDKIYNSLHEEIGTFQGHTSVADGLAACYMGNNKYLFFSVSGEYNSPSRGLYAYIVDMNANNGTGALTTEIEIETPHYDMSESVELVARAGTSDQYWLIYRYSDSLRVRLVDVGNVFAPVSLSFSSYPLTASNRSWTYTLKVSQQYNQVAIAGYSGYVELFDIDNATGILSNYRYTSETGQQLYGVEFSPNGSQLYVTSWNSDRLYQYEIKSDTLTKRWEIPYSGVARPYYGYYGGGLKLGPDGKIYVVQHNTNQVGVISNPDLTTTTLGSRYRMVGLSLPISYGGAQFSTGLTKPARIL